MRQLGELGRLAGPRDPASMLVLGWAYWQRYEATGSNSELTSAMEQLVPCLLMGAEPGLFPSRALITLTHEADGLVRALWDPSESSRDFQKLATAVKLRQRIVAATPDDHPRKAQILVSLAAVHISLCKAHALLEHREDTAREIGEAVKYLESAVSFSRDDAEDLPNWLTNLGLLLIEHAQLTRDANDSVRAGEILERAIGLMSSGHPMLHKAWEELTRAIQISGDLKGPSYFQEIGRTVERQLASDDEIVYALCAFLLAKYEHAESAISSTDPERENVGDSFIYDTKAEIFLASPELRNDRVRFILKKLEEDAEKLGHATPLPLNFLRAHGKLIDLMRETVPEPAAGRTPDATRAAPTASEPAQADSRQPWTGELAALVAEGRTEQAETLLSEAVRTARAKADLAAEGWAELARYDLIRDTTWPAPGTSERMFTYASASEEAFRSAGATDGLIMALYRLIASSLDLGRQTGVLEYAARLSILDANLGVWWNVYSWAVTSSDLQYARMQLEWCLERAGRLGQDAQHYRSVCESKLAVMEGRLTAESSFEFPQETGALRALLDKAEVLRSHAYSNTVQRGLSARFTPAYELLGNRVTTLAESVDILERNRSRALLSQTARNQRSLRTVGNAAARDMLDGHVATFTHRPTAANRRFVEIAFERARQAERHAEQSMLAGVLGPEPIRPPTTTADIQQLIGPDAVLFFRSQDAVLITQHGCRQAPADPRQAIELLKSESRLFVVPSAGRWEEPLSALEEVVRVGYVPSLSILAALLERPLPGSPRSFAGFADPDGSLPHARQEVRQAAGLFAQARTAAGSHVRRDACCQAIREADVLHLACHGFFIRDYSDFAGLHLTAQGGRPQMLWYSDIASEQSSARLVVLGACHAGTGEVRFGSEYVGLPGAFLASGARSVVAPLHAVGDEVTARLMTAFYPAYLDSLSPAQALRQARRSLAGVMPGTSADPSLEAFRVFGIP